MVCQPYEDKKKLVLPFNTMRLRPFVSYFKNTIFEETVEKYVKASILESEKSLLSYETSITNLWQLHQLDIFEEFFDKFFELGKTQMEESKQKLKMRLNVQNYENMHTSGRL